MMPKACNFIAFIWVGATILSFIIKTNGVQTKTTDRIGQRQEIVQDTCAKDSFRWLTRGVESVDKFGNPFIDEPSNIHLLSKAFSS